MERLALGASVTVSVAELLPGVGSETPAAVATVAVLASEPVAPAPTVQVEVYVTLPPAGRFTVSLMLPANGPAVQVPLPAPTQVVEQLESVPGKVSLTVEPGALLGPGFAAVMV